MDDHRTNRAGGSRVIVWKAFSGIVAILITTSIGWAAEPLPPDSRQKSKAVAAEPAVDPGDVTSITLTFRNGPGARVPKAIALIRTDKNAHYFHRLAKAMIDSGFFKLNDVYFRGNDVPGIEINVKYGNREKVVSNSEYRTLTDPTYLFEMLILGADTDMKTRLGPRKD